VYRRGWLVGYIPIQCFTNGASWDKDQPVRFEGQKIKDVCDGSLASQTDVLEINVKVESAVNSLYFAFTCVKIILTSLLSCLCLFNRLTFAFIFTSCHRIHFRLPLHLL